MMTAVVLLVMTGWCVTLKIRGSGDIKIIILKSTLMIITACSKTCIAVKKEKAI